MKGSFITTGIPVSSIETTFQAAIRKNLIRSQDSAVVFYDLEYLEERIQRLKSLFPASTLHGIAIKANPLMAVTQRISRLGVGVEAATLGEVMIALKSGFPPSRIIYDSPVKTIEELEFALAQGVHINLDSLSELERVAELKTRISSVGTVGIRINPQVGTGSIPGSSVAGEYSKFGVPVKSGKAGLLEAFSKYEWLTGVHLHVGSQGCAMDMLLNGIEVVYALVQEIHLHTSRQQVKLFDIGGGLPVSYTHKEVPASMEEYVKKIKTRFPGLFTDQFTLFTEFGRWVFVNSGWTVSRVEYVKNDPRIKTAMIHVGADLFVRECLNPSDWHHEYSILDKYGKVKTEMDPIPYNLAGPLCFSGDILAKNVQLPFLEEADFLIIHDTGGYTFSMWSHYNSRQTPRIIGYSDDGDGFEILKERGTFEELIGFWK